jgi:hypothetical protein
MFVVEMKNPRPPVPAQEFDLGKDRPQSCGGQVTGERMAEEGDDAAPLPR